MKPRVYLDTSVIGAMHDSGKPERQALTIAFWTARNRYDVCTSAATRQELENTTNDALRASLLASLAEVQVYPLTSEMLDLARTYTASRIFALEQRVDAIHIAAASLLRQDVLLSWNFKHLVNRRRRAAVHAVNVSLGLPQVDIISPPEL